MSTLKLNKLWVRVKRSALLCVLNVTKNYSFAQIERYATERTTIATCKMYMVYDRYIHSTLNCEYHSL